jgi:hypothetical protein
MNIEDFEERLEIYFKTFINQLNHKNERYQIMQGDQI